MKNWKSLIGYFVIITMYPYSIYQTTQSDTIAVTGTIAIIALFAMMGRSTELLQIIKNLIEAIKQKWSK